MPATSAIINSLQWLNHWQTFGLNMKRFYGEKYVECIGQPCSCRDRVRLVDFCAVSYHYSSLITQRYNLSERIATAIDDFEHAKAQGAGACHYPRVTFSMAELRSYNNLSERLRLDPLRHMRALEAACRSIAVEERGVGSDKEGKCCAGDDLIPHIAIHLFT
jgi:hypothetical protein